MFLATTDTNFRLRFGIILLTVAENRWIFLKSIFPLAILPKTLRQSEGFPLGHVKRCVQPMVTSTVAPRCVSQEQQVKCTLFLLLAASADNCSPPLRTSFPPQKLPREFLPTLLLLVLFLTLALAHRRWGARGLKTRHTRLHEETEKNRVQKKTLGRENKMIERKTSYRTKRERASRRPIKIQ